MSGFVLAPLAAQDLDDIWEFIAQDNLDAADRIIEDIIVYHPDTTPLEIVRVLRGSRDIPSLL